MWGWGSQRHAPAALPPRKEMQYQLYWRLGGTQGRSGQVRKISPPPGFDPRSVQAVASRYTDWAILAHIYLLRLHYTNMVHTIIRQTLQACNTDVQISVSRPIIIPWVTAPQMHQSPAHYHLMWKYGIFGAFFNGPKMRKPCGVKSRLYAGCSSSSHCMVFSWSYNEDCMGMGTVIQQHDNQLSVYPDICSWSGGSLRNI
jgi:hypothetical protein